MTTACNFMDGIDGIVSVHAVAAGAASAALLGITGGPWGLPLCLSAAAAGFLLLNRPPARLFMGDVGAHFIGFVLAATGIAGACAGLPLWTAFVLHGGVLFDTGYTLWRRALHRENLLQAHQKHLYQRLVRCGWSFGQVDAGMLGLDVLLAASCFSFALGGAVWGLLWLGAAVLALSALVTYVERRDHCFG
jgi:Fuc2NAc and GlcNAc transferase